MVQTSSLDLMSDPRCTTGTRIIAAPRALVFAAFAQPDHLTQWWGPDGFSITTDIFEFRPGGIWQFVMHGPDGRDYQNRITFEAIVEPESIVYRHGGELDGEPVQFTQTIRLEEIDAQTTRLVWQHRFATQAGRDRVIRDYGADVGLLQTMARLAALLETR